MSRLVTGGLIDRSRPIRFRFDGQAMTGFAGDTLASALVANDVTLIGRSFKYHRPRGLLTAGPEEPNGLVTLGEGAGAEPNTRATVIPLSEGLVAKSQNRWPNLSLDLLAINQLAAPLLKAGFYYKTFMWPAKAWEKLYEPAIRRAAGLGALSGQPDPDTYDRGHAFCDLLVIGGGPAGLAAALTGARAGLRVIVVDDDVRVGGRLLSERLSINGQAGADWAEAATAELIALKAKILTRSTVFGVYDSGVYGVIEELTGERARQRLWKITARRSVLASGAIERPLVFTGNDRPGVMMAGAVQTYLNRFAAIPGRRAVVATSTDSGWYAALDLLAAGIKVAAVIETRASAPPAAETVRAAGVEVLIGAQVTEAYGQQLSAIAVATADGATRRIACDLLAMSGGWSPAIGLGSNLGAKPVWSDAIQGFLLQTPPPGMAAAGAANGRFSLADALRTGAEAGCAAAADLGRRALETPAPHAEPEPCAIGAVWRAPNKPAKAFVDFQHDVTVADVNLATQEGFVSVEHLKRYTTLGMATDQGKTSQLNGHAALAAATGRAIAEVGTILSRPPWLPVAIGAFAGHHRGRHFRPERHTASHEWAQTHGASFVDVGQWKRAQWFAQAGESDWLTIVNREVMATRNSVGVCDVSTLGKIEVFGRDAGALLDRLYTNTLSTLAVGRVRYGLMLREDGFVLDDGSVTRFGQDHFYVTTTTANAAKVMQHLDFARQVLWPELDVQACSATEQWATYSVAGPKSRALLQRLPLDIDLSNAAFPPQAAAKVRWNGASARVFRLSFSGELAFEVSVPAEMGEAFVTDLFSAGYGLDVTPYGVEALGVMRIEKGHPAGGELNGRTTAHDLGFGKMLSTKKDFIGRVMARRPGLTDSERPRLVGLKAISPQGRLRAGAHLLPLGAETRIENDQGYITSACWSPTLGASIALALLRHGPERIGEHIRLHDPVRGPEALAEVCAPTFYDPSGERARG